MNILVYTTSFYPSVGGLEIQTQNLIHEFLKKGHQVKVVNIQSLLPGLTSSESEPGDYEIFFRPGLFQLVRLFFWSDIFYMPNISLKGIWLLFLNPFKKWVVSHNDFYLGESGDFKVKLKRFFSHFASENIVVSKSVAQCISIDSHVIYNCYDNEVFKLDCGQERNHDFVFLGRLVSQKGCDFLIRACQNLKAPWHLSIIGDGPEKPGLEALVQKLGLEKKVDFLGVLEGRALARELNRHEVMVIPSIDREGFGIVALEGMACGCKIIAAEAGGLLEAVANFGRTFTMGNQGELETLLSESAQNSMAPDRDSLEPDLMNYLAAHRKEAIAREYLHLFN